MADAAEMMSGPACDWLAARRQELNGRFRLAQRRFPRLSPDAVLSLCRELLPPLAGTGESGSAELLGSVYQLILLHVGRGTLAPLPTGKTGTEGSSASPLGELLRVTFPCVRRLLLVRPFDLPAALSNAVENLGVRGIELARGFAELADQVTTGTELLDAGAALAWRLGEARLRMSALAKTRQLAAPVVRLALGLADWPDQAVPLAVAGLEADGWRRPEDMLSPAVLAALPRQTPEQLGALAQRLVAPPARAKTGSRLADLTRGLFGPSAQKSGWRLAGLLGNFRGFDGRFELPPLLLDSGEHGTRHRFWVRSGASNYRLDADAFGCVCRPDPAVDFPVRADVTSGKPSPFLPPTATSCAESEQLIAFTLAESFRIRVFTPEWRPL